MTSQQQAIKIIKQLIDQSIEAGVLKNIETANLVYQSFQILNDCINNLPKEKNIDGTGDSNAGS
jgi:hypothetical protein